MKMGDRGLYPADRTVEQELGPAARRGHSGGNCGRHRTATLARRYARRADPRGGLTGARGVARKAIVAVKELEPTM